MTLEQFRKVWRAEPFQPFIINLADGRNVYVARSQYASRSYSGQTVFVYLPDEKDFQLIDDQLRVVTFKLDPADFVPKGFPSSPP